MFLNTYKSAERGRFDAAHELGHLVLHRHGGPKGRDAEKDADRFASEFLMPRSSVLAAAPAVLGLERCMRLKRIWQVSVTAMVSRLHHLSLISEWQYRSLFIEMGQRGYRTTEPSLLRARLPKCLEKCSQRFGPKGGAPRSGRCASHLSDRSRLTCVWVGSAGTPRRRRCYVAGRRLLTCPPSVGLIRAGWLPRRRRAL